jgi:hypothetical protein
MIAAGSACQAPWRCWQRWERQLFRICKLQKLKDGRESESHSQWIAKTSARGVRGDPVAAIVPTAATIRRSARALAMLPDTPQCKAEQHFEWWAHLVGALRVHRHKHAPTILRKCMVRP